MASDLYQRIMAAVGLVYWRVVLPLGFAAGLALVIGLAAVLAGGGRVVVLAPIGAVVLVGLCTGGFVPRGLLANVAHRAIKARSLSRQDLTHIQHQAALDAYSGNPIAAAILLAVTVAQFSPDYHEHADHGERPIVR